MHLPMSWDLLHLGYLRSGLFRRWDKEVMSQDLLRTRVHLVGTQCYAAQPEQLGARCDFLERLAFEPVTQGGGVGFDAALSELVWQDPSLVRLAPPHSLFTTLPGVNSTIRPKSIVERRRGLVRAASKPVLRRAQSTFLGRRVAPGER